MCRGQRSAAGARTSPTPPGKPPATSLLLPTLKQTFFFQATLRSARRGRKGRTRPGSTPRPPGEGGGSPCLPRTFRGPPWEDWLEVSSRQRLAAPSSPLRAWVRAIRARQRVLSLSAPLRIYAGVRNEADTWRESCSSDVARTSLSQTGRPRAKAGRILPSGEWSCIPRPLPAPGIRADSDHSFPGSLNWAFSGDGARRGIQAVLKAAKPWITVGGMSGGAIAHSQTCWCNRHGVEPVGTKKQPTFVMPKGKIPWKISSSRPEKVDLSPGRGNRRLLRTYE